MYNQVTDLSMKVRMVRISYFDTGINKELFTKYSFFIEDKDHVAERNNAVVKEMEVKSSDLSRENFRKLSVFQYIIGNQDWHIALNKNAIIMQSMDGSQELYAVPFDFDFSGFVNAEYTKISGSEEDALNNRRLYQGPCTTEEALEEIFDYYRTIRPVFRSILRKQRLIANSDRIGILDYIDTFYELIKDTEIVRHEFLKVCEYK